MTHVTRKTRRTTPKSTITEHTKNLIVAPKILSDPKNFQNQYFFQTQIFLTQNFFGRNFFFRPKNFFHQNFFRSKICRPKIFSNTKWTSMKTIFWGRKQSFCTWGFRNWHGQRFYLNWSLTLKTKSCIILFSV